MAKEITDQEYHDYWYGDEVATFGDRLAAAREYAGLDSKEFARRLGVGHSTVREWEDDVREPRANRLQIMAGLLNVSVVWLLTGEGEGVSTAPGEEDVHAPELPELLVEIRDIRAQMKRNLDQLALLEKKLRLSMKEPASND